MSNEVATLPQAPSLLSKIAARYSVDPNKMLTTLKATAFRGDVSNEQMMALLIVADQYGLNPWTKEIYAFPDKNNGIVPVVGVDGWARIINTHAQFDGMEFNEAETEDACVPRWIECVIYRKDRAHPIRVKEYYAECKRNTGPWQSHPRRMLRHKAMIQCARLAFGFVGIYDEDEAARIVDVTPSAPEHVAMLSPTAAAAAAAKAAAKAAEKAKGKSGTPPPADAPVDKATGEINTEGNGAQTYPELRKRADVAKSLEDCASIASDAVHLPNEQQKELAKIAIISVNEKGI